ncbi:MAG: cupin domain-containing protein [Polyangiales bacterium]
MSDLLKKALQGGAGADVELPDAAEPRPSPSEGLRGRLLKAAVLEGRFERFAEVASSMLDLSLDKTRVLLDRVDSKDSFAEELPGVEFCWLPGGPKTDGHVRGFVRVDRQAELPAHSHLGEEQVLVMQGTYIDSLTQERFGPGEVLHGTPAADHTFHVDSAGTHLLLLVVVKGGYQIGEMVIGPREVPPI